MANNRLILKSILIILISLFIFSCAPSQKVIVTTPKNIDDTEYKTSDSKPIYQPNFGSTFDLIRNFQHGADIDIKVQIDNDSFSISRSQITSIDQQIFNNLKAKNTPLIQIKAIADGNFVFKYKLNDDLFLEETVQKNKPIIWEKIEYINVENYPLEFWTDFIKQAVIVGLAECEVVEYAKESYVSLSFKQKDPSYIQFGSNSIKFNDDFYEYIKFSREYDPRTIDSEKLLFLVHEPHWKVAAQYQLVNGLKSLIDSNKLYNYRFLVEGYFEEENKHIPLDLIHKCFSGEVPFQAQVYNLLRKFLIDGPLAYRLLYYPDLPAIAIDDRNSIVNTPKSVDHFDPLTTMNVFRGLSKKFANLSDTQRLDSTKILNLLNTYSLINYSELRGKELLDHFKQLSELYNSFSDYLEKVDFEQFKDEVVFLRKESKRYQTKVIRLNHALTRDNIMTGNIVKHFNSEYKNHIPIAFIGSFHTKGIIESLPSDINYIVIEPRLSLGSTTKQEMMDFNNASNIKARPYYLESLVDDLKLPVGPTESELKHYEAFNYNEALKIKKRENDFKVSSPLGMNVTSKLFETIINNGFLANVPCSFAGNDEFPPSQFSEAFGAFLCGEKPKLLFYDKDEKSWSDQGRINYLKKVIINTPSEVFQGKVRKTEFYHDQTTNNIYFCVFDSESQKYYLFDWNEKPDLYDLMSVTNGEARVRLSTIQLYNILKVHKKS